MGRGSSGPGHKPDRNPRVGLPALPREGSRMPGLAQLRLGRPPYPQRPWTSCQAIAHSVDRYTDRLLFLRGERCGSAPCGQVWWEARDLPWGQTETGLLQSLGEHGGRGLVPAELSPLLPTQTPRSQLTPSRVPPDAQSRTRLLCICKAAFIFRLHLQGTE